MDHDGAHKLYHALPEVVADLLRLAAPELADELDLSTLERMPGEAVDTRLLTRVSDMVWRVLQARTACRRHAALAGAPGGVPVHGGPPHGAAGARVHVDVAGGTDPQRDGVKREGGPPPVLAVVVYNGSERWRRTAGGEAGGETAGLASPRAVRVLAAYQPQAYRLVDAGAGSAEDWPAGNRVAASVRLQRSRSAGELLGRLREEIARFPGEGNAPLREGLYVWAKALWSHLAGGQAALPSFEELERREEDKMTTLLEARAEEWKAQWLAEGVEKGVAQGIEKGIGQGIERGRAEERALLGRLAELKFGAPTAERLSGLLGGLTAPEELLEVGGWIIECGTGAELLDRVGAQAAARTARGGNGEC